MLGLNFSPQSKRWLSEAAARAIVEEVRARFPAAKFVGVFVDQEIGDVQEIADALALDAVQLHGNETASYLRELRAPLVIKALRVGENFYPAMVHAYPCDAILLDTWSANAPGGTGQPFPWAIAAAVQPLVRQLILAGGLSPENVGQAVARVRPFAVDVCSGIEDAPGRKNREKLERFIAAARRGETIAA